jgi:hypothetical protein
MLSMERRPALLYETQFPTIIIQGPRLLKPFLSNLNTVTALLVNLNATGLCNFNYYYEMVCFLYKFHKTEETLLSFSNLEKITAHPSAP